MNYHTPAHITKVKYKDLDYAVKLCLKLCSKDGKQTVYMGKTDAHSAFRILPLQMGSWKWVLMAAFNPANNEWVYFVEKCLPFGASVSCAHFQRFSDALKYLAEFKYLDDFIFLGLCEKICNLLIQQFLELCLEVGVPISDEKTEWATTLLVFLGILLDGRNKLLAIPQEKRERALAMLHYPGDRDKKKATVKQLQSLCGFLNFLCRAMYVC